MKRRLVLTNEAARHPFRQSIPAMKVAAIEPRSTMSDSTFFAASFISCFIVFFGMIW
jgi:hypothetical protein